MRTKTVSAVLSILFLPAIARANDWSELRADGSGSRATTEISGTTFSASWSYTMKRGGRILSTPVAADGLVVTAGQNGDMAALNLHDGQQRWARVFTDGIGSTPAVRNGRVVASTFGGELLSLDLASGDIQWRRPFGGGMNYSSPVLVPGAEGGLGSIILPAGFPSQEVSRIDLATGAPIWCTPKGAIADLMYTSAAITGQQAIVGMNGGRYQSLDLQTGHTRWIYNAVGPVGFSSPLVVGDTVYMFPGDSNSQLFAAKVDTGAPVSGFPLSIPDQAPVKSDGILGQGPAPSPPISAGGLIIFQMRRQDIQNNPGGAGFKTAMREYVVAVDPRQLKVVWQHAVGNALATNLNQVPELNTCPTPAAFSGPNGPLLAVSSSISARIAVLDVATGTERWSAPLSGPGRSSPIFANGTLLVGTDAGVLHAFSSTTNHPPTAPKDVLVAGLTSTQVNASWTAASDPEGATVSYELQLLEDGGKTAVVATTAAGLTTTSLTAKANTTYRLSIRARDAQGALSTWSPSVLVQTPVAATSAAIAALPSVPPADAPAAGVAPPPPLPMPTLTSCLPPTPSASSPPPPVPAEAAQPAPVAAAAPSLSVPSLTAAISKQIQAPFATGGDDTNPDSSVAVTASSANPTAMPAPTSITTDTSPAALLEATPAVDDGHLADRDDLAGGCSMARHGRGGNAVGLVAFALALVVTARRTGERRRKIRA
jgi:outer membrane protein assembly factor BamB